MAERKYQIFVSSTYKDLIQERTELLFAILRLNYIPAGMEFFTAIDEEQMEYIRRVIDESDYYVLVLGARYGSLDSQGISYTEREYDYAVQQGKKVIALIHEDPDKFEVGKTDKNDVLSKKFMAFREKVMNSGKLVSLWNNTTDLVAKFQASLIQTIQRFPATGWMRGDTLANTETLQKIAALELENQRLKESLKLSGGIQIATDLQMEACSTTTPNLWSESEVECVSIAICYQMDNIDMSLFSTYPPHISKDNVLKYYRDEVLPWFIQMARICKLDLKVANPFPFAVNNIEWEDCLIDKDGTIIAIPKRSNYIGDPPSNPDYTRRSNYMTPEGEYRFNLNPKRSKLLNRERFYRPEQDQDMIYQCTFFAENIVEPIKKEIKVHFRIKSIELDFNQLIRIIQQLEARRVLNDVGVFTFVNTVLTKGDKRGLMKKNNDNENETTEEE